MSRKPLLVLTFLTLFLPAEIRSGAPSKDAEFMLGGLELGETFSHFKQRFPGSACGTAKPPIINRHTLDDPDNSGYLTCCLDDPNQLAQFSNAILTIDGQCPVLAAFWKGRLVDLMFSLELSSIEGLLPGFAKIHGPPDQCIEDEEQQLRLVAWWHGEQKLELSVATLTGTETKQQDSSANDQTRERRWIQVSMWIDIGNTHYLPQVRH